MATVPLAPMDETQADTEHTTPRARQRRRRRQALLGVLAVGLLGGLGALAAFSQAQGRPLARWLQPATPKVTVFKVARTRLPEVVSAPGDVESSSALKVISEVEGTATIIFIKPEGSPVKKGELVCELDSGAFRDSLNTQKISTTKAKSDYEQAVKTREVAEKSVDEYIDGTYPQLEETMVDNIKEATTELENAQKRVEWSDRMLLAGYVTESQNRADHLTLEKCEFYLRQAQTGLQVLQQYTKRKQLTNLKATVDRARADELAKNSVMLFEQAKEDKLRRQVEKCKMVAPADGMFVYFKEERQRRGNQSIAIEEGASIRERQIIGSVPDVSNMRVNTRVDEAQVALVKPGLRARITVETMPSKPLQGSVLFLRPMADSRILAESDIRVYTAMVAIENPPPALRPGMTATVDILAQQHDDVLPIPVQAVLQFNGQNHVYLMTPKGPELRQVELGVSNDKMIVVKKGLQEGDMVALEPMRLMPESLQVKAFVLDSVDRRKDWSDVLGKADDLAHAASDTAATAAEPPATP